MEIREALQRGEDGEWDVTDKEFIYSSPQLLFHGHYSVLREALFPPPPSKVSPLMLDTKDTQTVNQVSHAAPFFHF